MVIFTNSKNYFLNKVSLNSTLKLALLLLIFFQSISINAQTVITKEIPKPDFCIIGISDPQFPKCSDVYDATQIKNYADAIDQWILNHYTEYLQFIKTKQSSIIFSSVEYEKLSIPLRTTFKNFGINFNPVFEEQKKYLQKIYPQTISDKGLKNSSLPYIYIINEADVKKWKTIVGL
jgi:hypothetical protein